MLKRAEVEIVKRTYHEGMRIRLIKMDDIQAPPVGTERVVRDMDDFEKINK